MVNELEIPYLSHEDIRRHAENFLYRNNKKDSIPVSIEKIIEIDPGLLIIPIPSPREADSIDGAQNRKWKLSLAVLTFDMNIGRKVR